MSDPEKEHPGQAGTCTGASAETRGPNPNGRPCETQVPTNTEAWERAAKERLALQKERRQEVADRLAEAQLELALLEIEIRRAELVALHSKGGPA